MTLFRNTKNGRLYLLAVVSPRSYTGSWLESQDYFTGTRTKIRNTTNFTAVAVI